MAERRLFARQAAILDAKRVLMEQLCGVVEYTAERPDAQVIRVSIEGTVPAVAVSDEGWDADLEVFTIELSIALDELRFGVPVAVR